MGMFDDLDDKNTDIMDDPYKREQIEQIAQDEGLTIEEAKAQFLKHNEQ